jgi:GC-rich sequence DNA-binding factor
MSMDIGDVSMQSVDDVFGNIFNFYCRCHLLIITETADNASSIPSEASILNAKQKRERIRTTTASNSEDYISLSVIKRSDENRGPHPESRLVREEDELGEGEDGMYFLFSSFSVADIAAEFAEYTSAQERIPLGKKSKKVAAVSVKKLCRR